jgi:hypothetical protein
MNLKEFLCQDTFIPARPVIGRPSIFLADYFDYLQKFDDAAKTGIYEWTGHFLLAYEKHAIKRSSLSQVFANTSSNRL